MIYEYALKDLGNDEVWDDLDSRGLARDLLTNAHRTGEDTIHNATLTEEQLPLLLQLGKVTELEVAQRTVDLISKRRGTLKFMRLVEDRQRKLTSKRSHQVRSAIWNHREATLNDGIVPSEFDTELWEQLDAAA